MRAGHRLKQSECSTPSSTPDPDSIHPGKPCPVLLKTHNFGIYQPHNPKASAYYKCVENHFEELEKVWDGMYASRLGFWRTYVMTVIYKYLDCGDLHMGFTRIRCEECGHEYLLAWLS